MQSGFVCVVKEVIMNIVPMPMFLAHNVGQITVTANAGESVNSLNKILLGCGVAIGAVIIVAAVVKLIIAASTENAGEQQKGAWMLGIGILFISISGVMAMLGINNLGTTTTANGVAANIVNVICIMAGYAGGILIVVGIIRYIAAIAQEAPDGMAKSTMDIVMGIGFMALKSLGAVISGYISNDVEDANIYVNTVIGWLCTLMSYAGGMFILLAVFKVINAIHTEDTRERNSGFRLALVGIALLGLRTILINMGFSPNINSYSTF